MTDETRDQTRKQALERAYNVAAGMVTVGFAIAVVVYLTAAPAETDPLHDATEFKKYQADLERIGGKTAVFSSQLSDWFASLWQGQTLAFTIAVLTLVVAACYLLVVRRLSASE